MAGLDLGQAQDFTALAVLERPVDVPRTGGCTPCATSVRFALGTPYTDIVPAVAGLVGAEPLAGLHLVVDQTGVGRAVVDLLDREVRAGGAGDHHRRSGGELGRRPLVPRAQEGAGDGPAALVAESRRLRVVRLPDADVLVREAGEFRVKISGRGQRDVRGLAGGPATTTWCWRCPGGLVGGVRAGRQPDHRRAAGRPGRCHGHGRIVEGGTDALGRLRLRLYMITVGMTYTLPILRGLPDRESSPSR